MADWSWPATAAQCAGHAHLLEDVRPRRGARGLGLWPRRSHRGDEPHPPAVLVQHRRFARGRGGTGRYATSSSGAPAHNLEWRAWFEEQIARARQQGPARGAVQGQFQPRCCSRARPAPRRPIRADGRGLYRALAAGAGTARMACASPSARQAEMTGLVAALRKPSSAPADAAVQPRHHHRPRADRLVASRARVRQYHAHRAA